MFKDILFYSFCAILILLVALYPYDASGHMMAWLTTGTVILAFLQHNGLFDMIKIEAENEDAELS